MKFSQIIPILRSFDEAKTLELYVDWLGEQRCRTVRAIG
jgi:hypothetical protein